MATGTPLRRQQSYLTEYDRILAEHLRKMSGGIGARDIAAESALGFPVGTMTAKVLGGVLAGGADRRAMNRDVQSKRAATELMKTPQTEITEDTAVGDVIYDPDNDSYSTISAAPVVAGVEGQTREEFEKNELAKQYANLDPEAKTRLQQSGYIPQVLREEHIPLNEREVLQPRESTAGMTIAGSAENPNWIERKLGDIGGTTVNSRAELAELAGYDALRFSEYERDKKLAEMPQREFVQVYDKNNNLISLTKIYNPMTGQTKFVDKNTGQDADITQYSSKKYDLSRKSYQVTDIDGKNPEIKLLTNKEVTELLNDGANVVEAAQIPKGKVEKYETWAKEYVLKAPNDYRIDQATGNVVTFTGGKIVYYHPNELAKKDIDIDVQLNEKDVTKEVIEETKDIANAIKTFQTTNSIINLESSIKDLEDSLKYMNKASKEADGIRKEINDKYARIKNEKAVLKDKKIAFKTDTNLVRNIGSGVENIKRDAEKIRNLIEEIKGWKNTSTQYILGRSKWEGTAPWKLVEQIKVMGGRIGFKALQDMRNSNKTGGGVGQLSDRELKLLMGTGGFIGIADLDSTLETINDFAQRVEEYYKQDLEWYNDYYERPFE